jgi:hypothetical protein
MAALSTIAALGLSAAGSAFSFIQAGKQADIEKDAQRDAAKALAEAKKKLEVNYLRGLSIAKEPYELESEALLTQGQAALQAGVEGDQRGAGATAGRVMQAQQLAQRQQRADMASEMQRLDELAAQQDVSLQGQRVGLDLGEATGQQQIAADARRARAEAVSAGVGALVDVGVGFLESENLYSGTPEYREDRLGKRAKRIAERKGLDAGKAFLTGKGIDYKTVFSN